MSKNNLWNEETIVAIDLETSGQYPLDADICEMGAIKWRAGEIVDSYSALIKPTGPMSDFVISIHNITNEMVEDAPTIDEKICEFYEFIKDSYIVAHHAPFDMGFLTIEFEKKGLVLPKYPAFCSSLLSRRLVKGTENHKLQTLVKHFGIDGGSAHRATDDARACLQVFLRCAEMVGEDKTIGDLFTAQNRALQWVEYSMQSLKNNLAHRDLVTACIEKKPITIVYDGGTNRGKPRVVYPSGLVRNPNGDYLMAVDAPGELLKRFYLNKIRESEIA